VTQQPLFDSDPHYVGTIYFDECGDAIKIGYTSKRGSRRIRQFRTGSPQPHRLRGEVPGTRTREREIHAQLAAHRIPGDVGTEWFYAVPEVLAVIDALIAAAKPRRPWSPFLLIKRHGREYSVSNPEPDPRVENRPTVWRRRFTDQFKDCEWWERIGGRSSAWPYVERLMKAIGIAASDDRDDAEVLSLLTQAALTAPDGYL
jgi:hypothetical protein